MNINANGTRFDNYYKWNTVLNESYNYERYGLLKHIMSPAIINSKNKILCTLKEFYEDSLIFLMRYVDRLKNFKNICWKNR